MTPNDTTPLKLKTFHPFPELPAELRHKVWFLALLSPLSSSPNTTTKPGPTQLPPFHMRPFTALPPNSAQETLLPDIPTLIEARHGPAWREGVLADHFREEAAAEHKDMLARYRASRTVFVPPGGKGIGGYDVSGVIKAEVEGVAASCEEARRVLKGLVRRFGGPEGWVDIRLGTGGVCCFWDVGEELRELRVGEHGHPRLVPGISFEDASRLDDGTGGEDIGMLRGLDGLVPAAAHCEVLAAVWSPKMCMDFLVPELELPPQCVKFKKDLMGLVSRHPKLHTLYLIDPSVQPSGLCVSPSSIPKFRGDAALFYELDAAHPDGWLTAERGENEMDVFEWAQELNVLLTQAKWKAQTGEIHVKVLACVPDFSIRALTKLLEVVLRPDIHVTDVYLLAAMALWGVLMGVIVSGLDSSGQTLH